MKKNFSSPLIPIFVVCLAIASTLLIPLRIVGYGFLPYDDALRHGAKVISQKSWDTILVLRSDFKMDDHPGWHTILSYLHKAFGWDQEGLVVFSIITLFFIFCLIPIFFLDRPESWLLSLFIISIINIPFMTKLFYGRPHIITSSILLILCFLWPGLRSDKFPIKKMLFITFLIAFSSWIGTTWYILAVPIFCFFLAREWRAGLRLCICVSLGILLGAIFTGHPYLFLKQSLTHVLLALRNNPARYNMVGYELMPFNGDIVTVIAVCIMLIWRRLRGAWNIKRIDNPIFILVVTSWVLGFFVGRFWWDWGMPALCVWMAEEFQDVFKNKWGVSSWSRILVTGLPAMLLYLVLTNNNSYFWMENLTVDYLEQKDPKLAKILPEAGGIIYNDNMGIFYQTFFKNPHAPWRYMLGFEPAWMPPEDLAIFRNIQRSFGSSASYLPWVKKMKPQDRLILKRSKNLPPAMPELEWYYVGSETWIGKLPAQLKN